MVRRWFQRGMRPRMVKDQRYRSAYIFGAVCPARDTGAALVLTHVSVAAMNLLLEEVASQLPTGTHAAMLIDNAGWHIAHDLRVPPNITLVPRPHPLPRQCRMGATGQSMVRLVSSPAPAMNGTSAPPPDKPERRIRWRLALSSRYVPSTSSVAGRLLEPAPSEPPPDPPGAGYLSKGTAESVLNVLKALNRQYSRGCAPGGTGRRRHHPGPAPEAPAPRLAGGSRDSPLAASACS